MCKRGREAREAGNISRKRLAEALVEGGYSSCVAKEKGLPCTGAARLIVRDENKKIEDPKNVILVCGSQGGQTALMTRVNAKQCAHFRAPRK